jgi:dolichol-phosphate mannosyltransferase
MAARLRPVLDSIGQRYEVVAVDDGSTDHTAAILHHLRRSWPQLRILRLRRNCGHQAAMTAGLMRSRGAYVASIDADLQDPPEKLLEMLRLAEREHLDIVYGVRTDRATDTWLKRNAAGLYYRLMRRLLGPGVPAHAGDFRMLSRDAIEALRELPEHQPVYRLLVPWTGFPSGEVHYVRERRVAGSTKYPLTKMARLAADSVTNFSAAPLRVATWLGMLSFVLCVLMMIGSVIMYIRGTTVPGWTSLLVAVVFLGGIQLLCLGLLGEYVGRIYAAVQRRPGYFVASDTFLGSEPFPASDTAAAAAMIAGSDPAPASGQPCG